LLSSTILIESSSAQAAKIKKKGGEIVEGEIKGFVVQADIAPQMKGDRIKSYKALYFKVAGADIETMDETGVRLRTGKKVRFLLVEQKEKPSDLEVLAAFKGDSLDSDIGALMATTLAYRDAHHGSLTQGLYDPAKDAGQIVVGSTPFFTEQHTKDVRIQGDFSRFKLLGTFRMEHSYGKVTLVPTIEIVSEKGPQSIALEEIVEFGPVDWKVMKD
ncbi:MAG: hypothetical protein ACRD2L_10445, partial [Terriglobia bacterium]